MHAQDFTHVLRGTGDFRKTCTCTESVGAHWRVCTRHLLITRVHATLHRRWYPGARTFLSAGAEAIDMANRLSVVQNVSDGVKIWPIDESTRAACEASVTDEPVHGRPRRALLACGGSRGRPDGAKALAQGARHARPVGKSTRDGPRAMPRCAQRQDVHAGEPPSHGQGVSRPERRLS